MGRPRQEPEGSITKSDLATGIPRKITLTVTPKRVKATLSSGQVLDGDFNWLDVGSKVLAHIFTHPHADGLASSLAAKSVNVTR